MSISDNVKRARERRGWTQWELCLASRINPTTIGRIERGENQPTIKVLQALADGLGVNIGELLDAKGKT